MVDLIPDWTETGTGEELQNNIGNGFIFKGPGIYLSNTDTLLVLTKARGDGGEITAKNIWNGFQPSGTVFTAYCYNVPYHETPFAIITSTPVREDPRSN
jgi:hypothetical protein